MSSGPARACSDLPSELCARLVEEAPYGVFVFQDGLTVHANRWVREFPVAAPAANGALDALALIHPDDREAARQRLATGAREAAPSLTVRLTSTDGRERQADLTTSAVLQRGRPAVLAILVDSTARTVSDHALQEYAARLEASNRFRRLFGDILSHDLMNPVWIAENYLKLVMDGDIPEAKMQFFDGMRNALAKAKGILTDARTYLRIQDQLATVGEPLAVAPLVEDVAAELRPLWEQKRQRVLTTLAPAAVVQATPRFREILWHLLSNAVKFGPPESTIEVVVGVGQRVRIEIRDRGPGVAPEDRERIFQRFEHQDKGPITGTGLGLAIVQRIAEQHRGRVWVEDHLGGGAIFVAEFPAAD